jgi:hypothetical protein
MVAKDWYLRRHDHRRRRDVMLLRVLPHWLAQISSVVAPAVLAIWVMQPSLDPGDVTLGILGTYLCHELKVRFAAVSVIHCLPPHYTLQPGKHSSLDHHPDVQVVPFWPMVLSLFAALYLGNGNEWITVSATVLRVHPTRALYLCAWPAHL